MLGLIQLLVVAAAVPIIILGSKKGARIGAVKKEVMNDVISRMGITSKQQLKEVNPNKLFNDMGGMRKKLKLDVSMVTLDDVKSWIDA